MSLCKWRKKSELLYQANALKDSFQIYLQGSGAQSA